MGLFSKNSKGVQTPSNGTMIVCPWCFETFHSNSVHFRSFDERCGVEPDELLNEFWMKMTGSNRGDQLKVIIPNPESCCTPRLVDHRNKFGQPEPKGKAKDKELPNDYYTLLVACHDTYGNVTSNRLCPFCHNELPASLGDSSNAVISILGYTQIGKTVYMTSLLEWLKKNLANCITGSYINFVDGEMGKLHSQQYKQMVNGQLAATDVKYISPMICEIGITFPNGSTQSSILSFYDFPGEAENRYMATIANHIRNANALMLLFDITKTETFWRAHKEDEANDAALRASELEQSGLVEEAAKMRQKSELFMEDLNHSGEIRDFENNYKPYMSAAEWLQQRMVQALGNWGEDYRPVAFVGTKSDEIYNGALCRQKCGNMYGTLCANASYRGGFIPSNSEVIHAFTQNVILKNDNAYKNYIVSRFKNFKFFSVSALGTRYVDSDSGRKLEIAAPTPWRVEEPVLWLLYMLNMIPGANS